MTMLLAVVFGASSAACSIGAMLCLTSNREDMDGLVGSLLGALFCGAMAALLALIAAQLWRI